VTTTAVVALLLLDLAAGVAWDRTLGSPDVPVLSPGAAPLPGDGDQPRERLVDTSARAALPAMAGLPWAEAYFFELDTMPSRWDPFLTNVALPVDGEHITIAEDETRASYEASGLPDDAPEVWFFGGSTTWGEGQRDEHTIPSEVARLAEAAGTPIRVENFAQRGWTIFQELLQLERQLAARPAPELIVFYDGTNDINVLAEQGGERPTVYNADDYAAAVQGGVVDAASGEVVQDESLGRQAWEWWRERSLVAEVASGLRDQLAVAPAAAGDLTGEERSRALPAAVDVYQRGRTLVLALAEEHDVPVVFFWQPERSASDPDDPIRRGAEMVGEPTIDLSTSLLEVDPESVYIDGGHTNELGARLVAEAMWPSLAEDVAAASDVP
jgi:lysophospholipase L1-like esterase